MAKTAALLELSGSTAYPDEYRAYETLREASEYYEYPVTIYDTKGTVENTIALLDRLYSEGYRIFIGMSRSTILGGPCEGARCGGYHSVLQWFQTHPEAVGISLTSTAPSLANKGIANIIRLTPPDTYTASIFNDIAKRYDKVYIFIQPDDIAMRDMVALISGSNIEKHTIDLSTQYGPSILESIMSTIQGYDGDVLLIPMYVSQIDDFRETIVPYMANHIDMVDNIGTEPPNLSAYGNAFDGRYFFIGPYSLVAPILRSKSGSSSPIREDISLNAYDAILIAKSVESIQGKKRIQNTISSMIGTTGYLSLDPNGDRIPYSLIIYQWSNSMWEPTELFAHDPFLGSYHTAL